MNQLEGVSHSSLYFTCLLSFFKFFGFRPEKDLSFVRRMCSIWAYIEKHSTCYFSYFSLDIINLVENVLNTVRAAATLFFLSVPVIYTFSVMKTSPFPASILVTASSPTEFVAAAVRL